MAKKTASPSTKKSTTTKVTTIEATADSKLVLRSWKSFYRSFKHTPIIGAIIAEMIGTFLLTASVLTVQGNPLYIAFALVGVILIVSGLSGVHLNPAVTIGAWVNRKINAVYAVCFVAAQIIGAVLAWVVLNEFLKASNTAETMTTSSSTLYHAAEIVKNKEWYIFFAELLGSTILVTGIASALKSAKSDKTVTALAYGFATLVALLIAASITQALLTESGTGLTFLNPAIAAASNSLSWNIWPIAIYVFAPIIGGIIGFAIQGVISIQDGEK